MIFRFGDGKVTKPIQAQALCRLLAFSLDRSWMPNETLTVRAPQVARHQSARPVGAPVVLYLESDGPMAKPRATAYMLSCALGPAFHVGMTKSGFAIKWIANAAQERPCSAETAPTEGSKP